MNQDEKKVLKAEAQVFKALAHPTRLRFVKLLAQGPRCVCELHANANMTLPTASRHLSVLKAAGIVSDRRQGLKVIYSLKTPCILSTMQCVTGVALRRFGRRLPA
jgi:ArsR family transcriptional regulator